MSDQLAMFTTEPTRRVSRSDRYAPYPAPTGMPAYSHLVVWRTCLVWEWSEWMAHRGGAG